VGPVATSPVHKSFSHDNVNEPTSFAAPTSIRIAYSSALFLQLLFAILRQFPVVVTSAPRHKAVPRSAFVASSTLPLVSLNLIFFCSRNQTPETLFQRRLLGVFSLHCLLAGCNIIGELLFYPAARVFKCITAIELIFSLFCAFVGISGILSH
jgi:hypothetical protein